jgi:guanosine-3',5'-bis(diphosphate) 3'-pyrophosphohydrolase
MNEVSFSPESAAQNSESVVETRDNGVAPNEAPPVATGSYLEHPSFSNPSPVPTLAELSQTSLPQSTLEALVQSVLPDAEDVAESLEVPAEGVTGHPDGFLAQESSEEIAAHESEETARAQVLALIERTKQMRPTSDADLLMRAYAFAHEKHDGQKRMTGEPYIEHPIAVAGILAELGMDDPTIAAGLLHDVPEDCGVSMDEMTERFGPEVCQLVDGVTKLKRIDFTNKQEKQAENLRKLFLAMAGDVRVIIIKLADRLHNMRTLDPFPENRKREIAAETLHILAPIAHRLGIWRVKWELEDRSFKYLEPQLYKQIYAKVQRTRADRSKMVQTAISTLIEKLRAEGIEAEVTGRPKHFYSIYQKMIKQGLQFDAIHDLIALRLICNTVPDCYHALGVVHSLWMQVPDMFFDYIAKPKPNNYQSLHTKVLGPEGDLIEVQIRTREMHREAEFGIAAHWRYKEGDSNGQSFAGAADIGSKLRWLRLVLELQSDTQGDAESFLDSLKLDLATDQIFAFTPKGDVIYLPQGSTPVDFAYRVHSEVGSACVGGKVNGRIVPLNYKLHNGDICEIITSRGSKGPKRGWLDFVVTPHAKNRIKSFLKKQNFDDNYREGLQRLEKAAQAERLKLGTIATNEVLLRVARNLKFKGLPELIAAIGYGEYSAENILRRVRVELGKDKGEDEQSLSTAGDESLSRVATTLLQRRPRLDESTSNGIAQGTLKFSLPISSTNPAGSTAVSGNFLYSLAKCCAPIPGDEVKGYITRGRGVTVHRVDCSNLKHYQMKEPDRLLDAHWTSHQDRPYQALIAVESNDRTGLLHDVTAVFAERRVNISAVNTYPLKNNRARLNIAATIRNSEELDDLIGSLRNIVGVGDVHRV